MPTPTIVALAAAALASLTVYPAFADVTRLEPYIASIETQPAELNAAEAGRMTVKRSTTFSIRLHIAMR